MSKRNYTHIKALLPTIQTMVAEGMTQREIAEHFRFKDKPVVKFALMRARKNETVVPKSTGRKPAKTLQEFRYENKRLTMEAYFYLSKHWLRYALQDTRCLPHSKKYAYHHIYLFECAPEKRTDSEIVVIRGTVPTVQMAMYTALPGDRFCAM